MKRLKKILKWTGVTLGALVAIALIANAIFVWTTDARLERQLAAIRDAGDPLTLADLARPPIPPEKNAATYLRQAQPDVAAIMNEISQWIEAEKKHELWLYFSERQQMPEKMRKAIKAIYAAHPKVIGLLQKAAECPDYDAHWDYSVPPADLISQMLPTVQELRDDARILAFRSRLLAIDGNCDEAARMSLALFRLTRHIDHNPLLVNYLVAITIRGIAAEAANQALQTGAVSKEVREALDAELAVQESMAGYAWTIKSERAYGIDYFCRVIPLRNFWLYSRGRWNRQESEYLDTIAEYLAMAPDGHPYRWPELTINDIAKQGTAPTASFAELFFPSLDATHQAVTRTRAMIRCLRVLNALQTHVPAASDVVPKLSSLGLPGETTTDPYTSAREPLHVKKLPRGWLVYSVGPNEKDDGGKIEDPVNGDVGVGPPLVVKAVEPAKK